MNISRISVFGLFGRFDHDIAFNPDERITIMIGPNGFGKTMILRILNALFNQPPRMLARMPFERMEVEFDNQTRLSVHKVDDLSENERPQKNVFLRYFDGETESVFKTPPEIEPNELPFPIGVIENIVPVLDQVGPEEWRHRRTGEFLDLEDVLEQFEDELPAFESSPAIATPDWFKGIRGAIPVRFIDTERLTHPLPYRKRSARRVVREDALRFRRTVRLYSEELADRIRATLSQYGSLAQSLDRTFPVRLVEAPPRPDYTMETLGAELAEVEVKRSKLIEAGLLGEKQEEFEIPSLEQVDEARRGVLAVYARDAQQKLSIFDDLYDRVDALRRIANARFLEKLVAVDQDGLSVENLDGSKLQLEMLSSGEQHELVILYELLFRVPDNTFILFDEPELSLHVAWQNKFLEDIEELAEISKFRALLATHSPQIIGDRWDLTVELRGPEET